MISVRYIIVCIILLSFSSVISFGQIDSRNGLNAATEMFVNPESGAEFPGGEDSMIKFLYHKIQYPKEARQKGIEGIVFVEFVIDTIGRVTECKVIKGIGYGCDEESIRVIKLMPNWKPARSGDKIVSIEYVLPITFGFGD